MVIDNTDKCPHCGVLGKGNDIFCRSCSKILPVHEGRDYFSIFGIDRSYQISLETLDDNLFDRLTACHPDKFISKSETEQEISLHNSTILNMAYNTLKHPMKRAKYILEINGYDVDGSHAVDPEFLAKTMEWREELMEADADGSVTDLLNKMESLQGQEYGALEKYLVKNLYEEALTVYTRLKFINRFCDELKSNAII